MLFTDVNSGTLYPVISAPSKFAVMKRKPLEKWQKQDAERLKALFEQHSLSQGAAAEQFGVTQGAVWQYLNGQIPLNLNIALQFARALKVHVGDFSPTLADKLPSGVNKTPNAGYLVKRETIEVPIFDAVASMGLGIAMPEHDTVIDHLRLTTSWVHRNLNGTSVASLAVISAYGDSMAPTFNDGDILLVDRGVDTLKIDAVYVLAINDELYIKRIQRRPDGSIAVISDNKVYDPMIVPVDEKDAIRVLGRVLWAWNGRKM